MPVAATALLYDAPLPTHNKSDSHGRARFALRRRVTPDHSPGAMLARSLRNEGWQLLLGEAATRGMVDLPGANRPAQENQLSMLSRVVQGDFGPQRHVPALAGL